VENPQTRIRYNKENIAGNGDKVKRKIFFLGRNNMKLLGLDIGSNSVGSAWIDTEAKTIKMGVSVFPAGVEESDTKRGAPKNQARRGYRGQRRSIERRAKRKHQMRRFLLEKGWMPYNPVDEKKWLQEKNPWILRREGLRMELNPDEFGRVLLHLAQRRGAYGFDVGEEEKEAGKIKDAISGTKEEMKKYSTKTFGELIAMKFEERRKEVGKKNKSVGIPIRNRKKSSGEGTYEFCADRSMIWDEFDKLWTKQKSFGGELAGQLTDDCRKELDDPEGDETWRYKGVLFGQRRTYWDVGTMARCDLEPTDLRCPKVDMYAQEFLVLETVNNIRITPRGEVKRRLKPEERVAVINVLEKQKTASESTIRKALKIDKGQKKTQYTLSLEKDPERGLNTNWFRREIVSAVGANKWKEMSTEAKESLNRAILKFEPKVEKDVHQLRAGCQRWWEFSEEQASRFVEAWKKRARIDDRVNYSRRAIKNLLPYMREGFTVNEARKLFAEDAENGASNEQRERYSFCAKVENRAARRYVVKHPDLLPPAPEKLSNPVVRKAIHEVRRHIQAYIREVGRKPDRVVVELAREARQSAIVRNRQLAKNREREKERKEILKKFHLERETKTQQAKAVKRVLLSREQRYRCTYCGDERDTISEELAASGEGVELDHIIPESRGGNSYLSNLVLCHSRCNRGKGNKTPIEWLTEEQFGLLEQRLKHLKKENEVKWDNLHKEAPDLDGFVESQLTDTAYASRQVAGWLRDVLYEGERDGRRRVFTTKGRYTSILRSDWGLIPDKSIKKKDRSDHRNHALDAVVIALSGPERLSQLAKAAEKQELAKSEGYEYPKRKRLEPAWGNFDSFRANVMKEWKKLVVAHRPEGRKITGSLHNDTQFGPVIDESGNPTGDFTIRKAIGELTHNHLRVPQGWEELRDQLEQSKSEVQRRRMRSQMLSLADVKPGKAGIVRDRWFREELRGWMRRNGLDPDSFDKNKEDKRKFKELVKGGCVALASGVPVRRVRLLRRPTVIEIKRKHWDPETEKMEYDPNLKSRRYYEPQNNHHIEIRKNTKGKWIGKVIRNFDAAKRVRVKPPRQKPRGWAPPSAVNREDTKQGRFVMSLSIGEIVYMKHPENEETDYFVVFKIDGTGCIHFTPHWDAGRDKETERCPAREDIRLSAAQLQKLGVEEGGHPQKVWVGPLGDVKFLQLD